MSVHLRDARTGRPVDPDGYAIESLSDSELEEELTIAAAAPDHRRFERYEALRREWEQRQQLCCR